MIDSISKTLARSMVLFLVALAFAATLSAQTTPATPTQTPASPAPDWKTYSYPADGFSASFAFEPGQQKKNIGTDAGTFELRAYISQDGESAMFVGVCDYGAAVSGRDPATVLQGAKNGALSNTNAHLVSEKSITLGVYPGVEFEGENDSAHFTARIYLVGTTLYQALTAAPLGKPYADTTRFLDSFQLIARTPAQTVPAH
ncbi:MAG: hypothetical protein ABSD72_14140 [Terracidiphilus sp.]|jgi:hypothetical protein